SFYLNPKWSSGITNLEAYKNQLNYLVEQKIFAQEAIKLGLDKEEYISNYLNFIHEKEMIKELYRQEVASEVNISEEEYKTAYQYMKKKVQFEYLSSQEIENAIKYFYAFNQQPLNKISLIASDVDEKGISPLFSYGDMAAELEEVVFNMQKDEIKGPVKVGSKYMVVKLIDGRVEKFMSEMDFHEKKSKIKKVIFERRANKISGKYIENLMHNKNVKINPDTFSPLSEYFSRTIKNKNSSTPYPIYINDKELNMTLNGVKEILDKDIVSYDGGALTVKEFLSALKNMPSGMRPQVNMTPQLKKALAIIVRDKHLTAKAKERGLNKNNTVLYESQIQTDEILAGYYLKKLRDGITCSEDEIEEFKKKRNFSKVNEQLNNRLTDENIADVVSDYKFSLQKMKLADSLKTYYECKIDSVDFIANIADPDKMIT
ncbi:MAG: hypothetical protein KAR38_10205, partial [Calditrichia bacterium]|nr:hypothetical protein [Calditrichia bacterium]